MKNRSTNNSFSSRRGSILLGVVIVGVVFAVIVASIARFSTSASRISYSDQLFNEARFGAQSLLNHGMAQVQNTLEEVIAPTETVFGPASTRAITLSPTFEAFFAPQAGSRLVLSNGTPFTTANFLDDPRNTPTGVVANLVSANAVNVTVSPDSLLPEEMSEIDARVREVVVYAKATSESNRFGERTAYVRQTFQVIDRSLYRYAMFWDGDLELWPGAPMTVGGGPVHTNGNLYLGSNNGLTITSQVTTAGNFFASRSPEHPNFTTNTTNAVRLRNFNIQAGETGHVRDIRSGGTDWSGTLDSDNENFRALASQAFNGGLLTSEHGIQNITPAGFANVMNQFGGAGNGQTNFLHHLISPSRDATFFADLEGSGLGAEVVDSLREIEGEKWSNQSDLKLRFNGSNVEVLRRTGTDADTGLPNFEPMPVEESERFWTVEEFAENLDDDGNPIEHSEVASGIFDQRMRNDPVTGGEINLLRFDMERFRNFTSSYNSNAGLDFEGVYIEMPEVAQAPREGDAVVAADPRWAVQIHNAATLPTGRAAGNDTTPGLTFATNAAMYIQGNFNSPNGGGTPTEPESMALTDGNELPVALVADAVTILSNSWDNSSSRAVEGQRIANETVVSAAIVTGNVPSANNSYSGGVENFPRFLENWNGVDLIYRGSMISLFRSESQNAVWDGGTGVYRPPNREWGYNSMYRTAPPRPFRGVVSYRRISYREMNPDDFYAAIGDLYN